MYDAVLIHTLAGLYTCIFYSDSPSVMSGFNYFPTQDGKIKIFNMQALEDDKNLKFPWECRNNFNQEQVEGKLVSSMKSAENLEI